MRKKKVMSRERRKNTHIGCHTRMKASSHHCPLKASTEEKSNSVDRKQELRWCGMWVMERQTQKSELSL